MIGGVLPTPFHVRTAAHNFTNAWVASGAYTVPLHYINPVQETLAARLTAAIVDISARQDLRVEGIGAAALLSTACGDGVHAIETGMSAPVQWRDDTGRLRGCGVVSCLGENSFLLRSADTDMGWFAPAAPRFNAKIFDVTAARGLLLLAGPYALPVLVAARLELAGLETNRHVMCDWNGVSVSVFRSANPAGYEIACEPGDALLVFDRLFRHRNLFGMQLAGEESLQILELEAGLTCPIAQNNLPDKEPSHARSILAGIEWDGAEPTAYAPVFSRSGVEIGRTTRSLYSPALKRAIALAELSPEHAASGTRVKVFRSDVTGPYEMSGRVVALPFL